MLTVTDELYKKHKASVEYLAKSFEKTTKIEADELVAYAWAKIAYAVRFHKDGMVKESTFINMVAKTAMTEIWEEQQKPIRAGLVSFESLVTEEEEDYDSSAVFCWERLSARDDTFLVELGITISDNAKRVAEAVVNLGLESKADIFKWGKEQGFRQTEIRFFIFELGLALQGKRVNYV